MTEKIDEKNSDPALLDQVFGAGRAAADGSGGAQGNEGSPLLVSDGATLDEREAKVRRAMDEGENPFLVAAQDLLRAVADFAVPCEVPAQGVVGLNQALVREVQLYTQVCDRLNLRRDHMLAVRYGLCSALDENIHRQKWALGTDGTVGTGAWSQMALLNTFHQDNAGGSKVFLLLGRMSQNEREYLPVLGVYLHLLGLGFQGKYAGEVNGARTLDSIRYRLYTLLTPHLPQPARELSPHWQGVGQTRFKALRTIPVWVTASIAGLILFALFAWFKYQLLRQSHALEKDILSLNKIVMAVPTQPLRLAQLLAPEINTGKVAVQESAQESHVILKGDDMFIPGQSKINPRALGILGRIAAGINEVGGRVQITGHSDNQPIKTPEFPDNQVLSEKRAQAVAAALQSSGVLASQITTLGRGDTMPLADNKTAVGRAKNRRVEMVVTTGGGTAGLATKVAPAGVSSGVSTAASAISKQ